MNMPANDTQTTDEILKNFPVKRIHFFRLDRSKEILELTEEGHIMDAAPDGKGALTLFVYNLVPSKAQPGQIEKQLISGYTNVQEFRISTPSELH